MGLGMGVVAAPCIGPIVLGLLLMVEKSGNPLFGFALFFTLAMGLGVPYVGLAMAAGKYPASAAIGRMAGVGRAAVRIRAGRDSLFISSIRWCRIT